MNQERIIEMYSTVWMEVTKGVHPDDWYNTEIEHKIAVKFAQLIIQECAGLVRDDDNAYDILKHFGVEE